MTNEECRQLAAQAWCTKETEHLTMDPDLAEAFALIMFNTINDVLANVKQIKK